jgi:hypothetical protein
MWESAFLAWYSKRKAKEGGAETILNKVNDKICHRPIKSSKCMSLQLM